ncbi:GNAT family N-acetyltransferase [Flavobacterium sp. CYK-4]|uniref:GNAT family N-acetyltransferase n=1 Tax=Flavobacterium lotistagni TaxID=2709660 RepID=UPI0014087415|nr:GNAT family protein [Flavobacterium lotistagni]NHM07861.1 GNAT family N-acetyltransferase [Flavobacterium lotistagni]
MIYWSIEDSKHIYPEEFFHMVQKNLDHISATFPITVKACTTLPKTQEFLNKNRRKQNENQGYYFYLRNTKTQKLIGYLCVKNINRHIRKCELAYFIDKDFQGQGITSEAVAKTVNFCFEVMKMNKVYICTSKVNAASQRIATKLGFKHEGLLREEFKNGQAILEDINYYGLLRSEYQP